MELGGDTKAVLLAAGLIFLGALLLGVWKYRHPFMWSLIVVEIVGFGVLLAGFIDGQIA